MSHLARIEWQCNGTPALLTTEGEVIALFKKIATGTTADNGIGVFLRKANNQEMTVIIAGEAWSLDWFPIDYDGLGSHHTVANGFCPDRDSLPETPDVLTYFLLGHHGEVPVQYTITEEKALDAIRQFLFTSALPSAVHWDPD